MPPNAELRPPPGHTGSVEVPLVIKRALGKGLSIDPGERFPSLDALIAGIRPDNVHAAVDTGEAVGNEVW